MSISAQRVARLYREGGILQAPPAMYAAITDWVVALMASKRIAELERSIDVLTRDGLERLEQTHIDAKALQENPTDWKLYKKVYDGMRALGYIVERYYDRDYQKITLAKRQALVELSERIYARVSEKYKSLKAEYLRSIQSHQQEMDRLRPFLQSGVDGSQGGPWVKVFPVDLTGWRYGDAELRQKAEAITKERARSGLAVFEGLPESEVRDQMVSLYRKQIETGHGDWDRIKVRVVAGPSKGYVGMWQPALRVLDIIMPVGAREENIEALRTSVRHELQHFAQSYLAFTLGRDPLDFKQNAPGTPGRKQRTPLFQQRLSPRHPSHDVSAPEIQKALQKLRQQGIDPRQVDFHNLDDLEFYTNLADSVAEFKNLLKRAPSGGSVKAAIKSFVGAMENPYWEGGAPEEIQAVGGPDFIRRFKVAPFFLSLKRYAPQKWKKAVSELTKAVL